MPKITTIFDFQTNIGGVEDFEITLSASMIPRKGESVGFNIDELTIPDPHKRLDMEHGGNSFFEIDDVTWNYRDGKVRDVRIFLKNFKD